MNLWTDMSKKNKILAIIGMIMSIIVISAIMGGLAIYIQTLPPGQGDNEIELVIPFGSSTTAIANLLEEHGIIKNALLFRVHLRRNELEGKLQAGTYQLNDGMTHTEISQLLLQGQIARESIRFTIPEGLNVRQIAHRLANIKVERTYGEKESLIDPEVFLELIQEGEFDFWFVNYIPSDVKYRLEGYLFPNTYEVHPDATEWDIINIMLRQFDRVFTEEFQQRAEELEMSVHEIVTLASIVEREAVVDKERPTIAGVFHNRLRIRMPLQSCATVFFITGREPVLLVDTRIEHPYNTYVHPGLPPGPIGSPGGSSIKATLFYEETGYFFFVTKKDGSGEHYFGVTYTDHLRNIARSNRN